MIATTKKPWEEILEALAPYRKVAVVGCDGCAKVCGTGGSDEVADLAKKLQEQGKDIVFEATPERTCNVAKSDPVLQPLKDRMQASEALIVLGCGGAAQITRHLTETYGLALPVKVGLNSVGHMDTLIPGQIALEECSDCGDCLLNDTGGICPVTRCAKSLLNGPCGGSEAGKCEVDPGGTAPGCSFSTVWRSLPSPLHKTIDPSGFVCYFVKGEKPPPRGWQCQESPVISIKPTVKNSSLTISSSSASWR
jgi:ferredoxin